MIQLIRYTLVIIMLIYITGCTKLVDVLNITKNTEQINILHPSEPYAIVPPENIEFIVITPSVTADWESKKEQYLYFALDDNDYLSWSAWIEDFSRYIKHQKTIIKYYREFYDSKEKK